MRFFCFFFSLVLAFSCAQVSPLTGGFKDTIPPSLISSLPENNKTSYGGTFFHFEFDELIDASDLNESLIVSPYYKGKTNIKQKKNTLTIEFDTAFNKETTYIINFAGGVSDVTEGNKASSQKFVFSTGDYIDSAFVRGLVYDPLKNTPIENALVVMYSENDSLGLFYKKPLYFSFSNENGFFIINNIKKGKYKLYAYSDENNNFNAEYKNESFGFIEGFVVVDSFVNKLYVPLYKEDLSEMVLLRTRTRGNVYETSYSKKISFIEIKNKEKPKYSLNDNLLRLYNDFSFKDSALVVVKAWDQYKNYALDSFYVSFNPSEERSSKVDHLFETYNKTEIDDTLHYKMSFSKPLKSRFFDSFLLVDTLVLPKKYVYQKTDTTKNNTISGSLFVYADSIKKHIDFLTKKLVADSLLYIKDSLYKKKVSYLKNLKKDRVIYKIPKGQFVSINKDTVETIQKTFLLRGVDYYGSVNGEIKVGNKSNYIVELFSEDFKRKYKNNTLFPFFSFKNINPGKYFIRVIEDLNKNKIWDYSSIKKNIPSERIIYFENKIEIRSNWIIEGVVFDVDKSVENLFIEE